MSAAVTSQLTAANPFVGLRPFGIDDADYFFGRDDETAEIIASLRQSRLLAIVGASGSGKSSLIYAGVLPSLPAHLWQVAVMNPGATPMENLRQALASALELPAPVVAANLAAGSLGVANAVAASSINPAKRILLFVDQFEELFTIDQPREPVRAFVQLLLRAVQSDDSRLLVLLTMRSEFLGSCSDFPGLPGAISRGLYLVDRPTRPQFRDAIIEPLRENGVDITDRLVTKS